MVGKPSQTLHPVAAHPFGDRRTRDLQSFGNSGLHPVAVDDQLYKFAAPFRRQRSMTMSNVRDEGLRLIE
ncbi:hypothetical protein IWX88_002817 [Frigoribacterium sp. CG_9.8]|nr:hypothetical protein [Frigoribacterium sp. CG_9.8]